jgi:transcriptional regulator with PAS, ATPase and Fis domain
MKVEELTSQNPAMQRCLRHACIAAKTDVPVLLMGETGTGKTLLAQAIHNSSRRCRGPFISFNAAAMSDTLLESQLFGHEAGAFTGAQRTYRGKFETADGGTLFFDEIADMSALAQAKILRAVEYGEFERLGSEQVRHADVRIISATNVGLRERIHKGLFREDLYQRLNGLSLVIPPLRERREDLPALIAWELKTWAERLEKRICAIEPDAFEILTGYPWPGNLRELDHVIQTVVLLSEGDTIQAHEIQLDPTVTTAGPAAALNPPAEPAPVEPDLDLSRAVDRHVRQVLELAGNQRRAARLLGISRSTLVRHLHRPVLK